MVELAADPTDLRFVSVVLVEPGLDEDAVEANDEAPAAPLVDDDTVTESVADDTDGTDDVGGADVADGTADVGGAAADGVDQ